MCRRKEVATRFGRKQAGLSVGGARLQGRNESWGVAGQVQPFFADAAFPAEGVAKDPQGLERGGDFPRMDFCGRSLVYAEFFPFPFYPKIGRTLMTFSTFASLHRVSSGTVPSTSMSA